MIIEANLPCGSRVGCGNDFAVAESQIPTFRCGRFPLRECGAEGLIVDLNGPLVSCVLVRRHCLLAPDCFQIVVDDLIRRGEFLRER